ncbi:MAG: hypothetical protein EA372_08095 [Chromatiaceae bacterium]|nr:MAG: hypothetical protein EA372_08095 [Chromatiaceae bacterium]
MTLPRSTLVCPDETPWYHVVSRRIRRALLCAQDHFTGNRDAHRHGWIEDCILERASVFAIEGKAT